MSDVTNMILTMDPLEDEDARIAEVNAGLSYGFKEPLQGCSYLPGQDAGRYIGGEKCLESTIYVAAFNYLLLDDFLAHLRTNVRWEYPHNVRVFIEGQNDESFKEVFHRAERLGVYVASKKKHAAKWRALRTIGVPIISTWIDEGGEGQTLDWQDLWVRCVREASTARGLIVYAEDGDTLKGALVEVGAALASGTPVYTVGPMPGSFHAHPLVTTCSTVNEAFLRLLGVVPGDGCTK